VNGDQPKNPGGAAPPVLQRPAGGPAAVADARSGAGRGLAALEVTTAAGFAAGLPVQGSLASEGPLRLFALAAGTLASGRLTIESEGREHGLHFKRGVVEGATSALPEDDLAEFLRRKGLLTEEQARDARHLAACSRSSWNRAEGSSR
jgi:hypothetical protein